MFVFVLLLRREFGTQLEEARRGRAFSGRTCAVSWKSGTRIPLTPRGRVYPTGFLSELCGPQTFMLVVCEERIPLGHLERYDLGQLRVWWGKGGRGTLSQSPHPWHEGERGVSHALAGDSATPGTWNTLPWAGTLGSHAQAETPTPAPWPEIHLFNEFSIGHTTDASWPLLRNKVGFPKSSPDDSCPASSLLTFGANDPLSSCVLQAFSSIPGPHPPAASNNPPTPHHPASITQNASGPCQMPPGDELASLRSWPGRAGPVPPGQTSTLY